MHRGRERERVIESRRMMMTQISSKSLIQSSHQNARGRGVKRIRIKGPTFLYCEWENIRIMILPLHATTGCHFGYIRILKALDLSKFALSHWQITAFLFFPFLIYAVLIYNNIIIWSTFLSFGIFFLFPKPRPWKKRAEKENSSGNI